MHMSDCSFRTLTDMGISGSIKIVQSKDPYACKTYACKTPSNQSVSSFMESIKDKSSLKILVVMI